ncbi:Crp/Fnr family transcriptional regulator [Carboxylicivirga sediminis]|uniref:Crp/Fnr family transcriptional regulator n=1 Tax=Carboxylicivirga sediminis TaxID=2006564 RepID=A0A941F8R8_9BACT|nr:Crp/Fnr family transcriptional regulator [Carboxylicivirga sediminis]MBR8537713.1 Crp/Fnr family transcriptional regulator [Carboxylicivirga sediminis]
MPLSNIIKHIQANEELWNQAIQQCTYYKSGEVVYEQDTNMKHAYFVNKGLLKIYRIGSKGEQQIVRLVKEGDLFGFHSLLGDEPEVTACESLTDSEVCVIPGEAFKRAISQNKELADLLIKKTCDELKNSYNSLVELSQRTVRGRLANLLLKLHESFKTSADEAIPLVISRLDMARWIGTSKESVSRLITEFKNDGIIRFDRRELIIANKEKLERIIMLS